MLETFTEAHPEKAVDPDMDAEVATVDSPNFAQLDEEASASMALRHAEGEAARGLACFGTPVLVEELDLQAQIKALSQHMEDLKVKQAALAAAAALADAAADASMPLATVAEPPVEWPPHWDGTPGSRLSQLLGHGIGRDGSSHAHSLHSGDRPAQSHEV